MNFTPISNRVLIEQEEAVTTTPGGLFIPTSSQVQRSIGTVVACGKGLPDEPMTLKVGDVVLYNENLVKEIQIEGKTYLMTREPDIIGII